MSTSDKNEENESNPLDLLTHPSYKELQQKLEESELKVAQYWDRIMRMQADSENALRRAERDIANAHKYALEKFVIEILPVIDSLELCVANAPIKEIDISTHSVIEGVHLTLKMFAAAMEKFGIKQVNPVSEPFNPETEQAISMEYAPDVAPGTVLSVLQKGYLLNERLIRPALVVVAKNEE